MKPVSGCFTGFQGVSRVFQGVSWGFQGCFMGVSRGFHGCFTAVFKNFEKEGVNFCRFRPLKSEGSGFPMTDMEKRTILTMRKNGNSYAAIAKELNIPVGTIKTICSREKSTDTNTNTGVLCLMCGSPIQINPNGREKQFCCRHCYNKWWHANHTVRTAYNRTCPVCGKEFTVRSNKCQKYCSAVCYQAARKAGGEHE